MDEEFFDYMLLDQHLVLKIPTSQWLRILHKVFWTNLKNTVETFDYLLSQIEGDISKWSNFRTCIEPAEKLLILLRSIYSNSAVPSNSQQLDAYEHCYEHIEENPPRDDTQNPLNGGTLEPPQCDGEIDYYEETDDEVNFGAGNDTGSYQIDNPPPDKRDFSQSGSGRYYNIGDYATGNRDEYEEADQLYAKLDNTTSIQGQQYYYLHSNDENYKTEEQAFQENLYEAPSDYYQEELEEEIVEDNYKNSADYSYSNPQQEFFSRAYVNGDVNEQSPTNSSPMYHHYQNRQAMPLSRPGRNNIKEDADETARRDNIYKEVLKKIDETVTELKSAGFETQRDSNQNLKFLQRHNTQDMSKKVHFREPLNESLPKVEYSLPNDCLNRRKLEQRAYSEVDNRNAFGRQHFEHYGNNQ